MTEVLPGQFDAPESVPIVVVPAPLDRNPAAVYLAGKPSLAGRRGLQRSLDRAAEVLTGGLSKTALTVNWAEVRYQHVAALRAMLIDQDAKPATINHVLAAVRGTLREAWKLELIDAESLARIVSVPNVKAATLPAGRHVDVGEVAALFRVCGDAPVGARDAAMNSMPLGQRAARRPRNGGQDQFVPDAASDSTGTRQRPRLFRYPVLPPRWTTSSSTAHSSSRSNNFRVYTRNLVIASLPR